jgi:fumarate reductase flavoprotein subunit
LPRADPGKAQLFRRYIGPLPDRVLVRHAGTAQGAGLQMAAAAGAALVGLDRFYGHLLSRDPMTNESLWPYPQIDAVATAAIVVDRRGWRLLDEGLGGISITNDLARLDDPLCASVICDAAIWETVGKAAQIRPRNCSRAAARFIAPRRSRSSPRRQAAVGKPGRDHRRVQRCGSFQPPLSTLSPERSIFSGGPRRIETPPFFAIPICAAITKTMGGVAIDGHGRVKRPDSSEIAGLYAAGGTAGGLEGGGALGDVGGLIKSCVFGLRTAEHAAASAQLR